MTKNELCKRITEETVGYFTQKEVADILEAIEKVVRDAVLKDDEVTLPGIGKIKTKIVPERTGKVMMGANKGETWVKPEHKEATIKIASSLRKIFE